MEKHGLEPVGDLKRLFMADTVRKFRETIEEYVWKQEAKERALSLEQKLRPLVEEHMACEGGTGKYSGHTARLTGIAHVAIRHFRKEAARKMES